ncbi:MAG: glycerophosphodiester phosphodiesterase [Lachnospiraceae bacterium]|nr:glycerophosphodiester phosphodiesterase [Lachnospiraceae bacterium]
MGKTMVWAHRGASGYAPENTIPSFALAKEQGADGVELDVQLSRDGELVVIHDERIDRTCNGTGRVVDYTLDELKRLDAGKTVPDYGRTDLGKAEIPTLKEVYELLKGSGMMINVELKTGIIFYEDIEQKVMELTARMGMEDVVIYSSFNHASMVKCKQLNPLAKCGLLYGDGTLFMNEYAKRLGMDYLHPALYNLQYKGFTEMCRRDGIPLHVWTVNEKEYIQKMYELEVAAIISNYPDRCMALRP